MELKLEGGMVMPSSGDCLGSPATRRRELVPANFTCFSLADRDTLHNTFWYPRTRLPTDEFAASSSEVVVPQPVLAHLDRHQHHPRLSASLVAFRNQFHELS